MKHAAILILTGIPFFLALFLLFGTVAPERFCDATSGAVVTVPNLLGATEKFFGAETVRKMLPYTVGGNNAHAIMEALGAIHDSPFKQAVLRFFMPSFTIVIPHDIYTFRKEQLPFLTLVDTARLGLLGNLLHLGITQSTGMPAGKQLGHALYAQKGYTISMVRNFVIVGEEGMVRNAIDVYEGKFPSVARDPAVYKAGRSLLKGDSDLRGVIQSSLILAPPYKIGAVDPFAFLRLEDFAAGAFDLGLRDDGLHARAILQSKPGKSLIEALGSGGKDYDLRRFLPARPRYAMGLRSSSFRDATDTLVTQFLPAGDKNGLRKKLLEVMFNESLALIGPEVVFFSDEDGDFQLIVQAKDAEKLAPLMEGVQRKLAGQAADLAKIVESPDELKKAIQSSRLSIDMVREYIRGLPFDKRTEAENMLLALLVEEAGPPKPAHPGIEVLGKELRYAMKGDLLLFSTSEEKLDHLLSLPDDAKSAAAIPFEGAGPRGSVFYAADLTGWLRSLFADAKGIEEFETILKDPMWLAAQLFDEGQSVRMEAFAPLEMGASSFSGSSLSIYEILFHALRVLLFLLSLGAGYLFVRRWLIVFGVVRA